MKSIRHLADHASIMANFDFDKMVSKAYREKIARDEAEIRLMLRKWVSELEPALIYMRERLVGLGPKDIPEGVVQPITIRAWER